MAFVTVAPEGPAHIDIGLTRTRGQFATIKWDYVNVYVPDYNEKAVEWMRAFAKELLEKATIMEATAAANAKPELPNVAPASEQPF